MSEQDQVAEATSSEEIVLEELSEGIDDPMVLKEQLAKEAEARRQLTARAKKAEADARNEREARIKAEEARNEKPESEEKIIKNEFSVNDEIVDLRLDGYSKDEVSFIMKNGGRKTLEDKNSYVAIALNTKREQAKAEAEASKATETSGISEIERKYTPEMMKNMSKEELRKILPHA